MAVSINSIIIECLRLDRTSGDMQETADLIHRADIALQQQRHNVADINLAVYHQLERTAAELLARRRMKYLTALPLAS